jgi:hypothetical protein
MSDYPHWQHFPKNRPPEAIVREVVAIFSKHKKHLDSREKFGNENRLKSNQVLALVAPDLLSIKGMDVEHRADGELKKIVRPVLYKDGGKVEKAFNPDAYHELSDLVIEVEAGMTIPNNAAYKDLIKACLMEGTRHFLLAVPLHYDGGGSASKPYESVIKDFTTIFESSRLTLPLETVTLLGY